MGGGGMIVDLRLDWDSADPEDYFRKVPSAIITLRDGRTFFAPWVHQYIGAYAPFADRYAVRESGEEIWYTRDGIYFGADRSMDIIGLERVTHEDANRRGLLVELARAV